MRSPASAELVVNVKNFLVASSRTVRQFADSKEKINVMENIGEIRWGIAEKIRKRRDLLSNQIQPAIAIAVLRLQRAARELPAELIEEQQRVNLSKRLIDDQHRKIREAAFRGNALGLLSTLVKACIGMFSTDTVILDGALEAVTMDMDGPVMLPGTDTGGDQIKTMFTAAKSLMSIMSDDDDHFDPEKVFSKIQSIATAVSASHLQNGDSESSGQVDEMVPTSRPSAATVNHRSEMKKGLASDGSATATLAIQEHYLIRREEWLRVMEHAVRNGILPLLDSFHQDMQNVFSGPERSRAALSLRSGLGEVRLALAPLTVAHGGLAAPRELQLCAELLDESLGVLVSLLDEIEEYREQLATAASVQSLKSRMVSWDIDFCTGDGENKEELKEGVAVLEKAIRANLVLERHNMAMHSYKQWAFPFASEYLNRTSPSMEERTVRNGDGAAISASTDINELLERLERNHAVITNRDSKIFTRYFKYPDSLHLWAHDQYEEHLDQLLEGKEVTMLANVLESPLHEDAVKFDTIDVRLVSTNESRQSELDLAFEESQISMTHLGVSYYKCGSQVFSVSVESQDISFSAKKKDGKPLTTNGVYDKLRDGDMMLSPYAVWKIKIDGPPSLFRVLSSFKGEVSLALEGHAQYVHGLQCSNSLRGYYKAVESKSELNVMAI
ncbi:uncharacterized protein LOC113214373 isoform X1 [Frankliniella occidentalis]|uniref:Uncharacterized protein LOC113214373 isoform X1 n=1 Tax=Frankliniella occidentalis TaxID=133901 RepID=A0A9C6XUC0_FRAOC|nr:uncharacterized protein LOC113214373 isoform X1 [Frankliniella occidentalis]